MWTIFPEMSMRELDTYLAGQLEGKSPVLAEIAETSLKSLNGRKMIAE